MNATELAEKIQFDVEPYIETDQFIFDECANMLRQQQAEIEALKYEKSSGVYDNEPVAWLNYKGYLIDDDDVQRYKDEGFVMTPLYTHPPKTLTDEEIEDLADKYLSVNYKYGEDIYVLGEVEFARAILRKAQEK